MTGQISFLEIQRLQLAGSWSTVFADNLILGFVPIFLFRVPRARSLLSLSLFWSHPYKSNVRLFSLL